MTVAPDVAVVGGGVVGAACARQLALAGYRVHLIERGGSAGEAWRASAGMLAPQIEVPVEDALFELGIAGREFYYSNHEALREATGVDIGLCRRGILQVAGESSEVAALRERIVWQRQRGHPCEWMDREEVRRDWPWLAPTQGALLAPRDGYLDPVRLVEAFRADAVRLGAKLLTDDITALIHSNGRAIGVQGRQQHPAEQIILAAGAWSGQIANLPRLLPVEPVRGQLVAYGWPQGAAPVTVFGHGGYLLPRLNEAIAGTTMEHVGFAAEVTEGGIASIRAGAEQLTPALRGQSILRAWAGLRPVTPDGLPIVGRDPEVTGLWYATGHGRNGILYAGITGQIVSHLLAGEGTFKEAELLRPGRFEFAARRLHPFRRA